MADQAALDKYRAEIVGDILPTLTDIRNRILSPGAAWDNIQDIQATLRNLVADDASDDVRDQRIADLAADIQSRILPPGAGWDNFQDLQNRLFPELLESVKELTDKVDALSSRSKPIGS